MSIDEKKLIFDVLEAIKSIDEHLETKRIFAEYLSSKTKRRAVERELEIIGEAINKLLKLNPTIQISYAKLIVNLRNKIIHAYDSVDNEIVWRIIMKDIPVLQQELLILINE